MKRLPSLAFAPLAGDADAVSETRRLRGGDMTHIRRDWLSIREVAVRLSVSTWQVRKWMEAGQFDEIVVFSKKLTRISRGAYDRFVAKNRQASA